MKKSLKIFMITVGIIVLLLCLIIAGCDEKHTHSYVIFSTYKEASCTEEGETRVYCECGEYISETISAPGHDYGEWTTIEEATVTDDGKKQRECSRCYDIDERIIPATGVSVSAYPSVYVSFDNPDNNGNFYDCISGDAIYNHLGVSEAEGRSSKGAVFDGTDYLEISAAAPTSNSAYTVSCWIKIDTTSLETGREYVIVGWGDATSNQGTALTVKNNRLYATFLTNRPVCDLPSDCATVWHHVALTYDGATHKLYLDGDEKSSLTLTNGMEISESPIYVGGLDGEKNYCGKIDELMIFNSVINNEEIVYYMDNIGNLRLSNPTNDIPVSDGKKQFDVNGTYITNGWNRFYYEYNGTELGVAVHLPRNYDPYKTYPLLISLHGDGYLNKTLDQIMTCGDNNFAKSAMSLGEDCIIVMPNAGTEVWLYVPDIKQYVDNQYLSRSYDMSTAVPSAELNAVDNLIDVLIANYPVDRDRVYLAGYSRGCMASFYLMNKNPERFSAAVLCCGAGDSSIMPDLASIPLWFYCGDQDNLVYYNDFKKLYDIYVEAGGQGHFTTCPGGDHGAPASYVNNNTELIEWVFSQKKSS